MKKKMYPVGTRVAAPCKAYYMEELHTGVVVAELERCRVVKMDEVSCYRPRYRVFSLQDLLLDTPAFQALIKSFKAEYEPIEKAYEAEDALNHRFNEALKKLLGF